MLDIYLGLVLLLIASVAAFVVAARFPRSSSKRQGQLLALACMAGTAVYAVWIRDSLLLARCLPFSNLIVLGNWFPIATGILAGLAWRHASGGWFRRCWPVVALGLVGVFAAVQPLLGRPPVCGNRWDDSGICRQTTPYTCTAACAATVLSMHGIPATEQEMAELCLTRRGTTWQGLYRGLKRKTTGTPFDVEVVSCPADGLRPYTPDCFIITVGLPSRGDFDPIYEERYSWTRGTMHTVLLFDFAANGRVEMADPDVGKEQWTVEDLDVLYRGRGLRLAPRAASE
jgi:hypothetical protein